MKNHKFKLIHMVFFDSFYLDHVTLVYNQDKLVWLICSDNAPLRLTRH